MSGGIGGEFEFIFLTRFVSLLLAEQSVSIGRGRGGGEHGTAKVGRR